MDLYDLAGIIALVLIAVEVLRNGPALSLVHVAVAVLAVALIIGDRTL